MRTYMLVGPSVRRGAPPGRPPPRRPRRRRYGRSLRALLLVALIPTLVGLVPTGLPTPATASGGRPAGPLVPAAGFYIGAYTKHAEGYGIQRQKEAISDLESRIGRRLHIDHNFYAWEDSFPTWREPWDLEHDRIPMISWNGANTDTIVGGGYDGMILARAQAVRELGKPVFLRWFWEMDGNKKASLAVSPPSYVKAWRHIHDLFVSRGATNAVWVWCPNASAFDSNKADAFYPGADYVDWICADGYNFAPNRPGDRWRNFTEIFEPFYADGKKFNKPMMIGEFGVLERGDGEKGEWFHDAHDTIASRFPAIAALVYFNADSNTGGIDYDWRVDTSESAFEGFRYLYTGPAPVPPASTPPPAPPVVDPPVAPPVEPPTRTPRTTQPAVSPAAPNPKPAAAVPRKSARPAASARRAPSPRLTWVLELLRQLDAEAGAPAFATARPPGS